MTPASIKQKVLFYKYLLDRIVRKVNGSGKVYNQVLNTFIGLFIRAAE